MEFSMIMPPPTPEADPSSTSYSRTTSAIERSSDRHAAGLSPPIDELKAMGITFDVLIHTG
jgi:hypothetical protein